MMQKIQEAGPVVGTIFGLAVKGKQSLPWPLSAMIDRVLFAKVKAATGGRLRMAICGGKLDIQVELNNRWCSKSRHSAVLEHRDGNGSAG